MPPTPDASVVVPVRNRKLLLGDLLDALDRQTYRDFEVIVVDDGSTDGSGEMAAERVVAGRPVRVVAGSGAGAVVARTLGVKAAVGRVLVFTDSDCRPEPGWLEAGMGAIEDGADVVNGRTRPARSMAPLERSIWSGEEGLFPTCNMFYRRSTFEKAGGFDGGAVDRWGFRMEPRARGLGFGEDSLLGWRAHRAGADVRYVPEARVDHHVFPPDLVESLSRSWMMAAFPALVRELPELRETLVHNGVMWGRRNRLPVYATAVAVAARKPRLAAGTVAWWALVRARDLRRQPATWGQRLAALPQEMLLAAVTAAALVIGSVRTRTILV
jgi:glycosyltransferase involved in cell wall biosynthesis